MQLVFYDILLYLGGSLQILLINLKLGNDMKLLMRETFVNPSLVLTSYVEMHYLEEESVVIPLAMTNLLQDNVHKREDDMEKK